MIRFAAQAIVALRAQALEAFPEECCGILGGRSHNGHKEVDVVLPLANRDTGSPDRRYFAPAESIRAAAAELSERRIEIVGFYHSHPNAPPRPSAHDLEHATWPWLSYVIVGVRDGEASELASWVLADDRSRFVPEDIQEPEGAGPTPAAGDRGEEAWQPRS